MRVRITAVATLVVAAAITVAGFALVQHDREQTPQQGEHARDKRNSKPPRRSSSTVACRSINSRPVIVLGSAGVFVQVFDNQGGADLRDRSGIAAGG